MKTGFGTITAKGFLALFLTNLFWGGLPAEGWSGEDFVFLNVERIVAVGDLHGDFEAYAEILESAGVRDRDGNWIGGKTHLVQTGDVVDRGPDSRKIYDDLFKLAKKARKKGGRVHLLIGNHEMMNMMGDLRYVHPGEYQAFAGRDSEKKLQKYFDRLLAAGYFEAELEDEETSTEDIYREWLQNHPPGFVEHRRAWGPGGEYFRKVIRLPALIKINDSLFTHAGLAPAFAEMDFKDFNALVRDAIEDNDQAAFELMFNEQGPLWYRGLAAHGESELANIETFLDFHDARRIVVGHNPTGGVILPRFDGRVIVNDVGLAEFYGGSRGFLLYENGSWKAVHWGRPIPLPRPGRDNLIDYLEKVAGLSPDPSHINRIIGNLREPQPENNEPT